MSNNNFHVPVMLEEALSGLRIKEGGRYIDCNLGGGGHTREIIKQGGSVLGIDCDFEAISLIQKDFKDQISQGRLVCHLGNFSNLEKIAFEHGFSQVDGVLYDLGMSSNQLEHSGRGFSFNKDEPLDMRMDSELKTTASDLVNGLSKYELIKLFTQLGEQKHSRAIAKAIVSTRALTPIKTSAQLAALVESVSPRKHTDKVHPATQVFQALRIAVNGELVNIKESFSQATKILIRGGRLVIISFHSLEERLSKELKNADELMAITEKPLVPSAKELTANPRCRSAKMRIYEKI